MRALYHLSVVGIVAVLAACSGSSGTSPPDAAARCGNLIVESGEQCDDGNAVNGDGCDNSCLISVFTYLKASNTDRNDTFGRSIALSADGSTLAVGAPLESSTATGIAGNQADNSAGRSGAVYVFARRNGSWSQQAYVKASNTDADDQFGWSVALSADGSILAVGARVESSAEIGVGGDQASNSAAGAGAVYVFARSGTMWSQEAYVKASNTGEGANFGISVALSADSTTLAVGAEGEASAATGINGDQSSTAATNSGAVYVFTHTGTSWVQQAYIKASNTDREDRFGGSVALSADGSTLVVGALDEGSAAIGVDGDQASNTSVASGAAYVFTRTGPTWSQAAYLKASNTDDLDHFGWSVAIAANGATVAVGAAFEASAATGINGDQTDNAALGSGAAYVFTLSGTAWSQEAYVKASNASGGFGWGVALSIDGSRLAVGAALEASAATGLGGTQTDGSAPGSGAAYVFTRSGTAWSQQAYVKASNTGQGDNFGSCVALTAAGATLAVGADAEASAATGVAGGQADDSALFSGAAYIVTGYR